MNETTSNYLVNLQLRPIGGDEASSVAYEVAPTAFTAYFAEDTNRIKFIFSKIISLKMETWCRQTFNFISFVDMRVLAVFEFTMTKSPR